MIKNVWHAIKSVVRTLECRLFGWRGLNKDIAKMIKDGKYDVVYGVFED